MKLKKMIPFLAGLMALLTGCGKAYPVDYCGCKSAFSNAKDAYRAGERVRLVMEYIATDTDYSFYVEGAEYKVTWENESYVVSFTMPDHEVKVWYTEENSMYMQPTCMLVVKPDDAPAPADAVSLKVLQYDPFEEELTAEITNNTAENAYYGLYFTLERKTDDGEFVPVEPNEEMAFEEIAYELEAGQTVEISCDIAAYDPLEAGTYRLVKSDTLSAEFELYEEWTE